MADSPSPLLLATVQGVWRNLCLAVMYMFLAFILRGGARRGGVDKMAVQIAPFPGVT